jgi:hypothetical protein
MVPVSVSVCNLLLGQADVANHRVWSNLQEDDAIIRCSPWVIFVYGVALRIVRSKDAMHPTLMIGVPVDP